jgi:hypothetical protein
MPRGVALQSRRLGRRGRCAGVREPLARLDGLKGRPIAGANSPFQG